MSKELHIALQEAIGDLGTDVLKTPFLVDVLQDYGALNQSGKDDKQIIEKLGEFIRNDHFESILSWRSLSNEQIRDNGRRLLKKYDNDSNAQLMLNAVLRALEMPVVPNDPLPATKTPTHKTKQSSTTNSSSDSSDIVGKVILVIGGIALTLLLIWLISEAFFFVIVIIGIIAAAKK